jgi:D-alanyl-lipoteichoic acid acyltransferase DltB (MBOAT superfamily)
LLFNSFEFPVFLALVLAVYYLAPRRLQNGVLLIASYVFYGWWDWRFLSLLALSTVVDFCCARSIQKRDDDSVRRRFLLTSIATNLGILGTFKYFDFFAQSARPVLAALGLPASPVVLDVVLPVGISFYTFQTMAYTIDVYRGVTRPARSLLSFAVYVSFFPQLVAGPIERSRRLLPQIERSRSLDLRGLGAAAQLILLGYFKKLFIADGVAPYVDRAFAAPETLSSLDLLLAVYLFALQIYADFSGYTDIARGVARLLGIELSLNFRQPYFSANVSEFWHRWHISLSTWLRDYLYIPLGGNRHGPRNTYRNLLVTMLLGGLWHGAAWHFVMWGVLHGSFLVIRRAIRDRRPQGFVWFQGELSTRFLLAVKIVSTFHLVCLAWVFFRADSISAAFAYLAALATRGGGLDSGLVPVAVVYPLVTVVLDALCWVRNAELPVRASWDPWRRGLAYAAMIALLIAVGSSHVRPFVYFQF